MPSLCPTILGHFKRGQLVQPDIQAKALPAAPGPTSRSDSDSDTLVTGQDNKSGATTPSPESVRADAFVREVVGIHARLDALDSLAPGPVVDSSLTRLVGLCCEVLPSVIVRKVLFAPGTRCSAHLGALG